MPDTEFWALTRVIQTTGVSKSEIYRLMRASKFPASYGYKHSPKRRFWMSHEVKAWQQQQVESYVPELNSVPENEFDELLKTPNTTQS